MKINEGFKSRAPAVSPLDSLDDAFPSPEVGLFVISFEYPGVVRSPAKVVVPSSFGRREYIEINWMLVGRHDDTYSFGGNNMLLDIAAIQGV